LLPQATRDSLLETITMTSISSQQQQILARLLRLTRLAEKYDDLELLEKGFNWSPKITDKAAENSRRASLSRALTRLEARGLITRVKGRKQARTSRLKLTDQGRRVAESLPAQSQAA
jgi:hypothetical protein